MIKEKLKEFKERREPSTLKMAFFDSIDLVPPSWDELANQSSVYLTTAYLSAIERAMETKMAFRYILFSKGEQTVAIAAFQIITVDSESLDIEQTKKRKKLVSKVLDQVKLGCLINGTLFGSGEHGFYYSSKINEEEAFKALADGTKRLCGLEQTRDKVHVIMVKEYFPENVPSSDQLKKHKYRKFKMEPNMILKLRNEWANRDDYFTSMTSKYRSKAKSSLKKSIDLIVKDLTAEEIEQYQSEIACLFEAVHDKAKHKLGSLNVAAFIDLKRNLKSNFILKAYFIQNKMVGFGSNIINNDSLDANYVGLDYEFNKSHSVYQRILYDLVQLAIETKLSKLHFGRTASEMKSNLGAKAVHMECYARTRNSVSNKIIKPLVERISTPDFVERNPFKE